MAEIKSENSEIFGRKIFFVCATFTLNTNIILRLMEQEYEIYKIDEPRQLKNLLELNPQSIVYFNVDTHFAPQKTKFPEKATLLLFWKKIPSLKIKKQS